ncbi:hypothetical protein TNCV_4471001 [Trichonephila clavipes]|uniref:Uncharacterized protein n=1 Tax=Trichonephila clavipes TaxID=2585209 RepID=A0A8X6SCQ0_TRICX|nr:hypothetical protein TNCV_4471001 [Trichonephila clavipes]
MTNSPSQMILDMLDWRNIWGSDRPRNVSNSPQVVLGHPCHVSNDTPYFHTSFGSGVSLQNKGRNEAFTTGSPHTNMIVITAEIESGFVTKDELVPFRCSPVSSCVASP